MASNPQKTLYLIGTLVLLLGLTGAATLYAVAGEGPDNSIGYEVVNGAVYPVATGESKRYRHDLEQYGGKMALLTDEFGNWFSGLWHGRSLAYTIGVISVALSGVIFLVASQLDTGRNRDETDT
jgi:ABC-type dipeptide/oligopeptide/nickel transport system permease subunit